MSSCGRGPGTLLRVVVDGEDVTIERLADVSRSPACSTTKPSSLTLSARGDFARSGERSPTPLPLRQVGRS